MKIRTVRFLSCIFLFIFVSSFVPAVPSHLAALTAAYRQEDPADFGLTARSPDSKFHFQEKKHFPASHPTCPVNNPLSLHNNLQYDRALQNPVLVCPIHNCSAFPVKCPCHSLHSPVSPAASSAVHATVPKKYSSASPSLL